MSHDNLDGLIPDNSPYITVSGGVHGRFLIVRMEYNHIEDDYVIGAVLETRDGLEQAKTRAQEIGRQRGMEVR